MEFKFENRYLLDNINIHDSEFSGYSYDYEKRKAFFSCRNSFMKKAQTFSFQNVILVHLQSCSFWHGGNAIAWMEISDRNEHLDVLLKYQQSNSEKFKDSFLDQGIPYFVVEFVINSGDSLIIVCESVIYEEKELI